MIPAWVSFSARFPTELWGDSIRIFRAACPSNFPNSIKQHTGQVPTTKEEAVTAADRGKEKERKKEELEVGGDGHGDYDDEEVDDGSEDSDSPTDHGTEVV
jgi:hypothetical protein